jgi:hypothetical protein
MEAQAEEVKDDATALLSELGGEPASEPEEAQSVAETKIEALGLLNRGVEEGEPTLAGDALLAKFAALPGGEACADCGRPHPSWASTNTGALICIQCSGVHRVIGTEYSAVLSCKLDDWEPSHIESMMRGNVAVNAELEAALPAGIAKPTPESDRESVEGFVWSKYGRRAFVAGGSGKLELLPAERSGGKLRSTSSVGTKIYAGILLVSAKRATGLKDKDTFGKSDPYLVCRVGESPQVAVTKVINDNLSPEWNETLPMNVASVEDILFVECYDSDSSGDKRVVRERFLPVRFTLQTHGAAYREGNVGPG